MSKFTDSSLIVEDYSDKRKSDEARWVSIFNLQIFN